MGRSLVDVQNITKGVSGKVVSHVSQPGPQRIDVHFTDASVLTVEVLDGGLAVALSPGRDALTSDRPQGGRGPTRRQQEYLEFIARHIDRYRVSPAESDIARHFLVSAPSVNQMVQMLERRGFIARQPGIPRSISIVDDRTVLIDRTRGVTAGGPRPNNALHRTGARVARSGG